MISRSQWLLLLVAALCVVVVPLEATASKFIFLSDIHYDPYYGTADAFGDCKNDTYPSYGYKGCDTPLKLLKSTLADISANYPDIPLILTGDWLRHEMSDLTNRIQDAVEAFAVMSKLFAELPHNVIPSPSLLTATIGNNDVVPDYFFDITNNNSIPHTLLGNMTQAMTNNSLLTAEEADTFSRCAMFSRVIDDLTFVVLNTLIWSSKLDPAIDPALVPDPCGQFAFLRSTLQATKAAGRKAVLLSHIPPTLNLFDLLTKSSDKEYLHSSFLDSYSSLLVEFNATLAAQFYGHTHELTVFGDPAFPAPGFVIPAITPNYDNDPSYLVGSYDTSFHSVTQRYFDRTESTWNTVGSTIDSVLGPFDSVASIREAVIGLYGDDAKWDFFQQVHAGGILHDIWPVECTSLECRKKVLCSMIEFRSVGYQSCLLSTFPTTTTTTTTEAPKDDPRAAAVSVVVVVLCVLSFILGIGGLVLVGLRFRSLDATGGASSEGVSLTEARRAYEETP